MSATASLHSKPAHRQSEWPLIIYNDDTCSLRYLDPPHSDQSLEIPLQYLAETQVGALCWCLETDIAYSWPSKVMENYYDQLRDNAAPRNVMVTLHRQGIDYLPLLISRARELGIRFYGSFRMNDCHHRSDPHGVLSSSFWRDHQAWRLWEVTDARTYYNTPLDYSYPQVRQRKLDSIHESIQWYNMDGVELDFCRDPYTFRPSQAWEKREILTDFLRRVRWDLDQAGKQRGRRLDLLLRVPFDQLKLQNAGMDVQAWLEEGLVDFLIMSSILNDYNQTLEPWQSRCREHGVGFYPSIEWEPAHNTVHNHNTSQTVEEIVARKRAASQNFLGQGAAGVYLFNYPCLLFEHKRTADQFRQMTGILNEIGRQQTLAGKAKEYTFWNHLPLQLESQRPAEWHQTLSFNLFDPDLANETTRIHLSFRQSTAANPHARELQTPPPILPQGWVTYWLNGKQVPEQWIARQPQPAGSITSGFKLSEHEKILLAPPASVLRQGENTLGFFISRFPEEHDPYVYIYELIINVFHQHQTGVHG